MICLKGRSFIKNLQRRGKGLSILQSCWEDEERGGAKSANLKILIQDLKKNNVIFLV